MSKRNTTVSMGLKPQELAALEKIAKDYSLSVSKVDSKIIVSRLLKEGLLECTEGIEGFYKYKDMQWISAQAVIQYMR